MNNKGFTMVELLVAMAIMGLLVIMAFPTIRAVQTNNNNTKYQEYGKAAVSAAKLYADSYAEDLFESEENTSYNSVSFDTLSKKDLLKDINVSGTTCMNSSVDIVKFGDDYTFCLDLNCTTKDGLNEVYSEKNKLGSCKNISKLTVTYIYKQPGTNNIVFQKEKKVIGGDEDYKTLTENQFGYNFAPNRAYLHHWKDVSSGKTYLPGKTITSAITSNITLEAITAPYEYKVRFKSSFSGAGTMLDKDCKYGTSCVINNSYKLNYYSFDKWKYGNSKYFDNGVDINAKINSNEVSLTYNHQIINLVATFRKNVVKVSYNANGGSLINPHSSAISVSNGVVKNGNESVLHKLNYDQKLSSDGLVNWNNSSYLNLARSGYLVIAGQEWNTAANGTGTTFNQTSAYTALQLCPNVINGDCPVTMYTKWYPSPPTCTLTASRKPNAFEWYNSDVALKLNTSGVVTTKGIGTSRYSTNGLTSYTASTEGKITYYGYVANAGGSNQCSITINLDKTKPVYKGKDHWVKNGNNEWVMYWKDKTSGLTRAQYGAKQKKSIKRTSYVLYCYGTSSSCSRFCTTNYNAAHHGAGGNNFEGTLDGIKGYWLRKAVIADNFKFETQEKDRLLMQTSRGCNGGNYTVRVEAHICDLAENCEEKYLSYNF